jgi:hypothetical protein
MGYAQRKVAASPGRCRGKTGANRRIAAGVGGMRTRGNERRRGLLEFVDDTPQAADHFEAVAVGAEGLG